MATLNDELNAVFTMIGIQDKDTCMIIIDQEGFMELADLVTLVSNRDVDEMAKCMAARTQVEGKVLLETVIIQCMKTLSGGLWI